MHSPKYIASALRRTVDGPMWHGPALSELLRGVSHDDASARAIPGAHSIWELVLHMTTWAEIGRARLDNREMEFPPAERDWPTPPDAAADAWQADVDRLLDAYRALSQAVRALEPSRLEAIVGSEQYDVATMLHGVVEHGCYHGGQIAILTRALRAG